MWSVKYVGLVGRLPVATSTPVALSAAAAAGPSRLTTWTTCLLLTFLAFMVYSGVYGAVGSSTLEMWVRVVVWMGAWAVTMVLALCPQLWPAQVVGRMKSGPLWLTLEKAPYPVLLWFCSAVAHSLTWQYVLAWLLLGLHDEYYYLRLCSVSIVASAGLLSVPTLSALPDAAVQLFHDTYPGVFTPVSTLDDDDEAALDKQELASGAAAAASA